MAAVHLVGVGASSSDATSQIVAAWGAVAAALVAVLGIIVTAYQNRKALATARGQLEQSENQLRAEVDGQRAQVALQRASDLRARLFAEATRLYNLADSHVIDQALSSFAAEVGRYLRSLAISDSRTLDSLIDDDRLGFIIAAAWARDPVARSYIGEVRHVLITADGFGGELRFVASISGIVSNIVNEFQLPLLQTLADKAKGPILRNMLKGNPSQGGELAAVTGIAKLAAEQLEMALPCLQKVQDMLKFAESLLSTEDDESMLAAALVTILVEPQTTYIDDLRSTLVPLAKRMGGELAATKASEKIAALEDALVAYRKKLHLNR